MLVPDCKPSHEKILSFYEKALHSLQLAVNDKKACYSAEVLCATAILAVFEVSDCIQLSHVIISATYNPLATELAKRTALESTYFWSISPYSTQRTVKVHYRV